MQQLSRGKFHRLPRTTAGFTTSAFDGVGLCGHMPARPAPQASNPVLVHRLACLLHASFRYRLAATPLRFAITSPPSGCEEDFHLQAIKHARHTKQNAPTESGRTFLQGICYQKIKFCQEESSFCSKYFFNSCIFNGFAPRKIGPASTIFRYNFTHL